MDRDTGLRPYHEMAEEAGTYPTPHLSDYWQVVSRRLWLVLLIFAVTTASAIWAVSRQRTFYRAHLSLQVNDRQEMSRPLTGGTRVSARDIYIDPIESEIQVLKSAQIAGAAVDSLGLRLRPVDPGIFRSALVRDVWVLDGVSEGMLRLVYDASGRTVEVRTQDDRVLGEGPVGQPLDAEILGFVPLPPPAEQRIYPLAVLTRQAAIGEVRTGISAVPRESTNIVDVTYTSPDPLLAPQVLNVVGHALREWGAREVQAQALRDVAFIEDQLQDIQSQREASFQELQEFKETRAFTDLSAEERALVTRTQETVEEVETLQDQRAALAQLIGQLEASDVAEFDVVQVLAGLPQGANPQIQDLTSRIRDRKEELREILTTGGRTRSHPQAVGVQQQIAALEEQLAEALRAGVGVLARRIAETRDELATLRARQAEFPELQNRLQALELQLQDDQQLYSYTRNQLVQAEIRAAAAAPYVEIVDPATGSVPIQPRGRVNVLLGALLGLVLGVGAAFFLEYLDRTVRTSADVESLLGIPVLGVIPRLRRLHGEDDEEAGSHDPHRKGVPMVVALDPLDPAAEAYRNLRMNLLFSGTEDEPVRTVLFSSPGPDEGKSTTAVNFAIMLAQQGQRVLLLDADLRRPQLHRGLDLLREPGLTNLLVGDVTSREAVRPNVLPNLDVLPSGPFPPNPSELLDSKAMSRLMGEFREKYDHVIVDSPPVLAVTDASLLGSHVDGMVLVLRSGETEQRAAERAVDQLRRLGVRLFGAVLNEVAPTTTEESYYLHYYYSYQPTDRETASWSDRIREGLSKARFW